MRGAVPTHPQSVYAPALTAISFLHTPPIHLDRINKRSELSIPPLIRKYLILSMVASVIRNNIKMQFTFLTTGTVSIMRINVITWQIYKLFSPILTILQVDLRPFKTQLQR